MPSSAIDEQRLSALQHANDIRRKRSNIKAVWRNLDEHEVSATVAMLIGNPPEWTHTWRIAAVLRSIPHWGEVAVNKRLNQLGIPHDTSLVALTPGQRLALVELLAPQMLNAIYESANTTE
ncbi:MAG: hypothetical protein EB141_00480 [Verrucomicrobia bacterium]|nr:hypothetical protein [Verrucomicrobiota bacterium]NBV22545.1 hypothetical protein [Pseudomonadota bacterium]NDA65264.1 hypothetical protein [Verrucomicrobiota bacterium]NDB74119.1 hypothetical protein [Verrucomicrobiota bacterium]NDD36809.1 hypothetical protein [Verrucomicrobiota bacterium]